MVFGPVGVLDKDRTVEAIAARQRWVEVEMSDRRFVPLAGDAVLIHYKAAAKREGDGTPYVVYVSSVYVRRDGAWKLAFHQHTPSA